MSGNTVDFSKKFRKVYYEIDYLKSKIYKKTGFFIFKSHTYSVEDLLKSEHFERVYSITEKIGSDAQNWYRTGNLSDPEKNSYEEERDNVDHKLHMVRLEIQDREPTWWESICDSFGSFVDMVMKNMPKLVRTLLDKAINKIGLPSPIRKVLGLAYSPKKVEE